MKQKRQSRQELYGTKEVARILGIPDWRVKNFTEGAAYRLPPAHQIGSGKGSRRLYGWEDIFRIGLAQHLVDVGFTAEAVGQAVREVPESVLTPYEAMLSVFQPETDGMLKPRETRILCCKGGAWRVVMAPGAQREFGKQLAHGGRGAEPPRSDGFFAINLANVFDAIFSRLEKYRAGVLDETE